MPRKPMPIHIGEVYKGLKVIEDLGNQNHHHYYMCECTRCHKIIKASGIRLLRGKVQFCRFCGPELKYIGIEIAGYTVLGDQDTNVPMSKDKLMKICCNKCKKEYMITIRDLEKCRMPVCKHSDYQVDDSYFSQFF